MNPEIDRYLDSVKAWSDEFRRLRTILLDCQLTEALKWGKPCYMVENVNIAILQGFKEYCALMFFKGALLKDPEGLLVKPGVHTQAGRQIRFKAVQEIVSLESVLKNYISEAIEIEKSGLEVQFKQTNEYAIPEELQTQLDENSNLRTAFHALTPGRQRAYILYFSAAKQSKTRLARIEKSLPRILDGKGLDDR